MEIAAATEKSISNHKVASSNPWLNNKTAKNSTTIIITIIIIIIILAKQMPFGVARLLRELLFDKIKHLF